LEISFSSDDNRIKRSRDAIKHHFILQKKRILK
jgi:hypothetical protein